MKTDKKAERESRRQQLRRRTKKERQEYRLVAVLVTRHDYRQAEARA